MGVLGVIKSGGLIPYLSNKSGKKATAKAVAAATAAADANKQLAGNIYRDTAAAWAPGRGAYSAGIGGLYQELGFTPNRPTRRLPTSPLAPAGASMAGGGVPDAGTGGYALPTAQNSAPVTNAGYTFTSDPGFDPNATTDPGYSYNPRGFLDGTGGGFDAATYLAQNPDVAAEAANHPDMTPEEYAAQHAQDFGQAEGRNIPTMPVDHSTDNYGAGPAPDAFDMSGAQRPTFNEFQDPGPAPAFAFDFKADPGYAWRQQEAARGGNASFGARGLLKSGGAIKAAQDRSYNLADQAYNTAYDQYMQRLNSDRAQYNTGRAQDFNIYANTRDFANNNFNTDLNFAYGASRDNRTDFTNDRSFGAGRADTRVNNLFNLTTVGQNAVAGTANAGNVYTGAVTDANNSVATAQGNKALADYRNNFWNQIIPVAANAAGRAVGGGF